MAARAPIPIETERISPCLSFRFLLPSTARFFDATVFDKDDEKRLWRAAPPTGIAAVGPERRPVLLPRRFRMHNRGRDNSS